MKNNENFRRSMKVNNSRNKPKLNKKKVGMVAAALALMMGGTTTLAKESRANKQKEKEEISILENAPSIDEMLKRGYTYEDLGISKEMADKLGEIKEKVKDENIENKDLIDLGIQTKKLELDTMKIKIGELLKEDIDEIELESKSFNAHEQIINVGSKAYNEKKLENRVEILKMFSQDAISPAIAEYVEDAGHTQYIADNNEKTGNINREKTIRQLENGIKKIEQIATVKIVVTKDGDLELKEINNKDKSNNDKSKINKEDSMER